MTQDDGGITVSMGED